MNTVELNLPAFATDAPPDPDKAVIILNGVPIENVVNFSVSLDARNIGKTRCNIGFYAKVVGKFVYVDSCNLDNTPGEAK